MTNGELDPTKVRQAIEESEKPRKRRTPEELRAHYQAQLQKVDENEKREVIRLLSGVADDLQKATTFVCSKPVPEIAAMIATAKAALLKLGVK